MSDYPDRRLATYPMRSPITRANATAVEQFATRHGAGDLLEALGLRVYEGHDRPESGRNPRLAYRIPDIEEEPQ